MEAVPFEAVRRTRAACMELAKALAAIERAGGSPEVHESLTAAWNMLQDVSDQFDNDPAEQEDDDATA